ncbi:MAG: glycosyltransferase family 4 protein [Bryobacteraceae bacterium]
MSSTRVLLVAQSLGAGGSERQLTEIAKALDRSQFDPRVACFRPGGIRTQELESAGVPVLSFPFTSLRSWQALHSLHQLKLYLREERIEILHGFDPPANMFAVPVARLAGTPVVLSSQRSLRSLRSPRQRRVLRWTDRLVQGTVVNSEAVRQALMKEDDIPFERIHLCRNGLNTNRFRPVLARTPNHAPLIGSVCVLRPEKGLETLIHAFAVILRKYPLARLRIIGSGPAEPELQSLSTKLNLKEACEFLPATANVAEALQEIDIFVLPSLSEAMSNSLMEAMACGCCAVASDVGGNPELVSDGSTGLLFRTGDEAHLASVLERLLADPAFQLTLGEAGCRRMHAEFTLEHSARTMGQIYDLHLKTNQKK